MATRFLGWICRPMHETSFRLLRSPVSLCWTSRVRTIGLCGDGWGVCREPEWHGDAVELFVCDEEQARLNNVRCEPATKADDLRRNRELGQELKEFSGRLGRSNRRPRRSSSTRRSSTTSGVTAEAGPAHAECHLFKYREGNNWRLVWGWGYQRRNLAPATPTIRTNPGCSFAVRPLCRRGPRLSGVRGQGRGTEIRDQRSRSGVEPLISVLCLLLLAAAAGVGGYLLRDRLWPGPPPPPPVGFSVEPETWTTPLDGQIQFTVFHSGPDGQKEDVTSQAVAVVEDPSVVSMENSAPRAMRARSAKRSSISTAVRKWRMPPSR